MEFGFNMPCRNEHAQTSVETATFADLLTFLWLESRFTEYSEQQSFY